MSDKIYVFTVQDSAEQIAFTMPQGFESTVEVHCWGAGGGTGWGGFAGGAGGYAKSTTTINPGDSVVIQVGEPGANAPNANTGGRGGVDYGNRGFGGGNGGTRGGWCGNVNGPYPSGGGGGASYVLVNETPVCVGAGGGGTGGYGHKGIKLGAYAGGQYQYLTASRAGGDASYGGGGGGGYLGGGAGYATGHAVSSGSGGQNYGDVTIAGAADAPAGTATPYYTGSVATSGQRGYVVLVFTKKIQIYNKDSGVWEPITNIFYKTPTALVPKTIVSPPQTVTFTNNDRWTVPAGVTRATFAAAGGAGGAGGGDVGGDKNNTGGGGGGGSNFIFLELSVTPGEVYNIEVGAGGAGSSGGGTGGTGGTSRILSGATPLLTAEGGTGGSRGTNGGNGSGGTGANGADNGLGITGGSSTNGGPRGGNGIARYNSTGESGQSGKVYIQYVPPTEYITVTEGGWKGILRGWTKVNGVWKELISNSTIESAINRTITYNTFVTSTFTVPAGVTQLNVVMLGGGGGGGGRDSAQGYPGYSGYLLTGNVSVTAGDVVTLAPGGGGAGGADDARSGAGGAGGVSSLTFDGGRGGNSGGSGISGAGGGGGAASVMLINGNVIAVAAGGAGGGGGGNGPVGLPTQGYSNSGAYFGSAGADKSGDGGGAGGGGGGFYGGAGGALVGGDSGAYSGSDGVNKVPSGWTSTRDDNGGIQGIRGVQSASAGANGYIILSYKVNI
jgi:hypothetical protein